VQVEDGKVVVFHYALTTGDGFSEDTRTTGAPMAYLHGKGQLVPGLERSLAGRAAPDRFQVTVAPADGFGERKGKGPQPIHKKELGRDAKLAVGMPLDLEDSAGRPVRVWVTRIQGARVWIDIDHPFAGKDLTFDVELLLVRDPTPEELSHGHAHGADGRGTH
jgi:FKBP-type peptidyl-prolyl cis-trans isomerase SlyD